MGTPFEQTTLVVQGGFDGGFRGLLTGDDLLLLGVFAGMTQAEAEVKDSDTALDLEGWGGGLYASYLWQGLYLDAVLKGDLFQLDYSIPAIEVETGQQALALGGSLEVGCRFALGSGIFVEPQAQISYLRVELEDLDDIDGSTRTWCSRTPPRCAAASGSSSAPRWRRRGTLRPYAEVSGLHEFLGETEAVIGDAVFASSVGGNAVEFGLGISVVDASGRFGFFLDSDYVTGEVGSSIQVQGGVRVTW